MYPSCSSVTSETQENEYTEKKLSRYVPMPRVSEVAKEKQENFTIFRLYSNVLKEGIKLARTNIVLNKYPNHAKSDQTRTASTLLQFPYISTKKPKKCNHNGDMV